jgi:hypothetical protein
MNVRVLDFYNSNLDIVSDFEFFLKIFLISYPHI